MELLLSSLIGYLLGSIPTAFLFVKFFNGNDITKVGSGNVGTLNSYEVTNSKLVGIGVFIIDFIKGLLTVIIVNNIFTEAFIYPATAVFFAVFAHCFNPWLKFKGGRGLATAAGASVVFIPLLLIIWVSLWIIAYAINKNIHFGNIWGTVMSIIIVFSSKDFVNKYSFIKSESPDFIAFFCTSVLIIIFIKHIEPLVSLIDNSKLKRILK